MNEEIRHGESLKELTDTEYVSAVNPPNTLLRDNVEYFMASPKARPYIKVQNDISTALRKDGLSDEQQRWLLNKEMEAADKVAQNTPQDKHPCLRVFSEGWAFCAVGVTILCIGAAYRCCWKN